MKKTLLFLSMCAASLSYAQNSLPTTGNVGIGTTSPSSELEVKGNTTVETFIAKDSSVFEKPVIIKDSVKIESKMTVDQDVKIKGQTVFVDDAKAKADFKVLGTTIMKGDAKVEGDFKFKSLEDLNTVDERFLMIKPNGKAVSMEKGGLIDLVYSSGKICAPDGQGNYPAPVWENEDGNPGKLFTATNCPSVIGIGTENPQSKLHVEGKTYINQNSPQNDGLVVELTSTSPTITGIGINTIVDNDNRIAFNVNNINSGDIFSVYGSGQVNVKGKISVQSNDGTESLTIKSNSGNAGLSLQSTDTEVSEIKYFDQFGVPKGSFTHKIEFANSTYSWSNITNGIENELMKLTHDGTLYAHEVKVVAGTFPDYVFDGDYRLLTLEELQSFIQSNGHLPNMPTEKEVLENGLDVGELEIKLVEKVEELTLYIIQLKTELDSVKTENQELRLLISNQ